MSLPLKFSSVIKSENDPNEYRYTTLPNGIDVLLVRTPFGATAPTDKSNANPDSVPAGQMPTMTPSGRVASKPAAVALSTRIGFFADPPEFPGLAHFLEHMLFMVRFSIHPSIPVHVIMSVLCSILMSGSFRRILFRA
jgi:hypothetical protein